MKEMRSENPATLREWDRLAIEEYGIPGIALMENAGAGAARIISGLCEKGCPPPFIILCSSRIPRDAEQSSLFLMLSNATGNTSWNTT